MLACRKLIRAFKNALRGIQEAFIEQSFRILFVIALIVVFCLFYFPFDMLERAILVLVVTLVLSLELINSQIERILDILRPDYNEEVRKMKDISAGAVLTASIGAVILAFIIIFPYILTLLERLSFF
jgi:diacylglycerol kinase